MSANIFNAWLSLLTKSCFGVTMDHTPFKTQKKKKIIELFCIGKHNNQITCNKIIHNRDIQYHLTKLSMFYVRTSCDSERESHLRLTITLISRHQDLQPIDQLECDHIIGFVVERERPPTFIILHKT